MLPQRSGVVAYLSIGSNQGDRAEHLWRAAEDVCSSAVTLRQASSVYASAYVGPGPPQAEYLNAVLEVTTTVDAWSLLALTQDVERRHGRRRATHLQPRPLDVDILFFGTQTSADPRLQIPHPRLAERRFVLEPLHELGVLDRLPIRGLRQRLLLLRRQQAVTVFAEWSSLKERRGLRV